MNEYSNEKLVNLIDVSKPENAELVKRFALCLGQLSEPNLYFKSDVEKTLAGGTDKTVVAKKKKKG